MTLNSSLPMENVSVENDSYSEGSYASFLVIGLPIFLENVLAVFILTRCDKLVYQIRYLSLNLSLADCLLGLMLIIPGWTFEGIFSCKVKKYFNYIAITSSLTTATFINLDRCCSIHFNMKYFRIMKKKRLKAACCLSWLWGILLSYIQFFNAESETGFDCSLYQGTLKPLHYVGSVCIRLTVVVNIPMFLYMVYYVKKRMIKLPILTHGGVAIGKVSSVRENTIRKVILITGFLFACYTPIFILRDLDEAFDTPSIARMAFIAEFLVIINSLINPLLYAWRYYETRYQLLRLLYKCNPQKSSELFRKRQEYFSSFDIRSQRASAY